MGHSLNYNQLYYFFVIANEGSIKAACEKLHVTQPTISGQLRQLEESLGCKLFQRKHRKLILNNEGQKAYERAKKIFSLGNELMETMHQKSGSQRENIKIGVSESITNNLLHDFTLNAWKARHISLDVIHDNLPYLIELMNKDELDIILSDSSYDSSSKRFKSLNIGSQKLYILGHKKFKNLKKDFPNSLHQKPFLNFSKATMLERDLDYFFKLSNIVPDFIGKVDDLQLATLVAKKGHCLVALPEKLAKDTGDKDFIILGEVPGIALSEWVIISKHSQRRLSVRKVINDFLISKKKKPFN